MADQRYIQPGPPDGASVDIEYHTGRDGKPYRRENHQFVQVCWKCQRGRRLTDRFGPGQQRQWTCPECGADND